MYLLQPLLPRKLHPTMTYVTMIFLITPVLGYLSYAKSLQSKRIIYATSLSIFTYVLWISVIIYNYTRGPLERHSSWLGTGSFWPAIGIISPKVHSLLLIHVISYHRFCILYIFHNPPLCFSQIHRTTHFHHQNATLAFFSIPLIPLSRHCGSSSSSTCPICCVSSATCHSK